MTGSVIFSEEIVLPPRAPARETVERLAGRLMELAEENGLARERIVGLGIAVRGITVSNRRGVSVGRETGSAYHFVTAYESAHVMLPNILRSIAIPMVKVVFDTTVCDRTPWGRGLLPDYELPLTYKELIMGADGETDVMLEYALQLIADGKYLSTEDPFVEVDTPRKASHWWIWLLGAVGVIAIVVLFVRKK